MRRRKQSQPALSPRLERVHWKFESWRQSKEGNRRIPETLWKAAVKLAKYHSVHQIARTLHLNHTDLMKRVDAARDSTRPGVLTQPTFVEVDFPGIDHGADCVIEFENSGGAKMRISLKGQGGIDLKALGEDFWRQS